MAQQIDKVQFQKHIGARTMQFEALLKGSGVDPAKFMQIVTTAVLSSEQLLECHINSVLLAALEAAQDGLMPDGNEGAIIAFNDKYVGRRATWIPMVSGLLKKIIQSGEVTGFTCEVVHEGDDFEYELGAHPDVRHRRRTDGSRKNPITHVYSIAYFANGFRSQHVMSIAEVLEIRDRYSRSKSGPWSDPVAFPEMVKKTCLRQHAKILPMSADATRVFRRMDAIQGVGERPADTRRVMEASALVLDHFALPAAEVENERQIEGTPVQQPEQPAKETKKPRGKPEPQDIESMGNQYVTQALSYIRQVEDSDELNDWSDRERPARANLSEDQKKTIIAAIGRRMMEFKNASSETGQPQDGE